jgi:hypothetical protein
VSISTFQGSEGLGGAAGRNVGSRRSKELARDEVARGAEKQHIEGR